MIRLAAIFPADLFVSPWHRRCVGFHGQADQDFGGLYWVKRIYLHKEDLRVQGEISRKQGAKKVEAVAKL